MSTNILSEQRFGSNGWAIDELLVRGLKRLIQDLRAIETEGFGDDICRHVRDALQTLSGNMEPGTAASFVPEIISESDRFHQRYVEWNGNGTESNDAAVRSRRGQIDELFFWRSRMMEKLSAGRKGFTLFATEDDFAIVRGVYERLGVVVAAHPNIFVKLSGSVTKFNTALKVREEDARLQKKRRATAPA
jgi:hypothetical protein